MACLKKKREGNKRVENFSCCVFSLFCSMCSMPQFEFSLSILHNVVSCVQFFSVKWTTAYTFFFEKNAAYRNIRNQWTKSTKAFFGDLFEVFSNKTSSISWNVKISVSIHSLHHKSGEKLWPTFVFSFWDYLDLDTWINSFEYVRYQQLKQKGVVVCLKGDTLWRSITII